MSKDMTPDSRAVQRMAKRVAEDGSQVFEKSDDFGRKYGAEAYEMLEKGSLISALWQYGIDVTPARYEGASFNVPVGIELKRSTAK
jgi:hypothetical protein